MTPEHPITPPPELVQRLRSEAPYAISDTRVTRERHLIAAAYRAGADAQLDAVMSWLRDQTFGRQPQWLALRDAMRPKPPSLVRRALHILGTHGDLSPKEHDTIRQALEHLDD